MGLDDAWGGGTRIGDRLLAFERRAGEGVLMNQTFVIIFSDGLDAGDTARVREAMREIARRSAAVVWLNPHLRSPGFAPTASGMAAALPFITALDDARTPQAFAALARHVGG